MIHCTDSEPVVHLAAVHDGVASQENKEEKKQDGKDPKEGDGDKMEGKSVFPFERSDAADLAQKTCDQVL